jgi:hypothetical protein
VRTIYQQKPLDLLFLNEELFILLPYERGINVRQRNGQWSRAIAVDKLNTPRNMVTDGTNLFVSDIRSAEIYVFDTMGHLVRTIRSSCGSLGCTTAFTTKSMVFYGLESIAIDVDEIFALDCKHINVLRLSDGQLLRSFPNTLNNWRAADQYDDLSIFGGDLSPGSGSITVHNGHIHVSDGYHINILNMFGQCIHHFGSKGKENGHFKSICRMIFYNDQLVISDFGNSKLQVLL